MELNNEINWLWIPLWHAHDLILESYYKIECDVWGVSVSVCVSCNGNEFSYTVTYINILRDLQKKRHKNKS